MKIRVGFGFDVHQLVEGRELWLGGIRLEHSKGLLGHSDIAVTQKSYAQVVNRNISNHMNLLEKRLQGKN